MANTTQAVEEWLVTRHAIGECLRAGLINFASLARTIHAELPEHHEEAIATALRRQDTTLTNEAEIRQELQSARLDLRTNVSALTYPVDADIFSRVAAAIHGVEDRERIHLFHGWSDLRVVADVEIIDAFERTLPAQAVERLDGLVELNLSGELDVVGFLASATTVLAREGINLIDVSSCSRDHIFLLEEADLPAAMSAFHTLRH